MRNDFSVLTRRSTTIDRSGPPRAFNCCETNAAILEKLGTLICTNVALAKASNHQPHSLISGD